MDVVLEFGIRKRVPCLRRRAIHNIYSQKTRIRPPNSHTYPQKSLIHTIKFLLQHTAAVDLWCVIHKSAQYIHKRALCSIFSLKSPVYPPKSLESSISASQPYLSLFDEMLSSITHTYCLAHTCTLCRRINACTHTQHTQNCSLMHTKWRTPPMSIFCTLHELWNLS